MSTVFYQVLWNHVSVLELPSSVAEIRHTRIKESDKNDVNETRQLF